MASPLNNPWVSGGLGAGILVYFVVSFTPQGWKEPIRNFFTGELKRQAGKEPELQIGTERLFRAVPQSGPGSIEALLARSEDGRQRPLFRETPKGVEESDQLRLLSLLRKISEIPAPHVFRRLEVDHNLEGEMRARVELEFFRIKTDG